MLLEVTEINQLPKRSRPSWLSDVDDAAEIPDRTTRSILKESPETRTSSSAETANPRAGYFSKIDGGPTPLCTVEVPLGSDWESSVVREYVLRHKVNHECFEELRLIIGSVSTMLGTILNVVGGFADGTASRSHSLPVVSVVPRDAKLESREIVDVLSRAGFNTESSAMLPGELLITTSRFRILFLTSSFYLHRTYFVRVYTHLIDPRVAVLVCLLRSRIVDTGIYDPNRPVDVDYFLFLIIWKALIKHRILPNFLLSGSEERDGEIKTDKALLSGLSRFALTLWCREGVNAKPAFSLKSMLALVIGSLDCEMIYDCNKCPLTGEIVLIDDTIIPRILEAICVEVYDIGSGNS